MTAADRQRIIRATLIQIAIGLGVAGLLLVSVDRIAAMSALAGAAIALAGSLLFALVVYAPYRAADPGGLTRRLYVAEFAKLALIAGMFAWLFDGWQGLNPAPLFVTFFLAYLVPWMVAGSGSTTAR